MIVRFAAALPQSKVAVSTSGDGESTIKLEVPESDLEAVQALTLLGREKVLFVSIMDEQALDHYQAEQEEERAVVGGGFRVDGE